MIGKRLNHYQILESLGRGGMGEVYLAEDIKLNRKVALKVLPTQLAHEVERRQRFEREAQAIAKLSHPGIITIYSVEEAEGVHFITMELVQGKTLSELFPRNGMRLNQILDITIALADALAAAHEHGITHRDLKPDNVMIADDGRVKILDFGLAKYAGPSVPSASGSELPTKALTEQGRILGTVAYMSPEQAQGEEVDPRSDLFSLGSVLYEMATGELPFRGTNPASTIAAILKDVPRPPAELRRELPRDLTRIIRRLMAKELFRRYQSALDLRNELEETRLEVTSGAYLEPSGLTKAATPVRRLVALAAGAALVAGALGLVLGSMRPRSGPRSLSGNFSRLTSHSAEEYFPSFSPDGEFVVYAGRASGNWDLYLQRVSGDKAINLTENSAGDDTEPALSPDGKWIAFRSERRGGGVFVMGATGENVKKITDFGHNPAWSPNGTEIVCNAVAFRDPLARTITPEQLWAVNVATGQKRLLTSGDGVQGSWSPHGYRIAYWGVHQGGQRDIWTVPSSGGTPVQVTEDPAVDWNPVWSPDGRYLFFLSDRGGTMNLWRVAISERSGEVREAPEPVTTPSVYSQHLSLSKDGRYLAYVQLMNRINLQQVGFDPRSGTIAGKSTWVTQGSRLIKNPDLSPDGEWLIFDSIDNKQEDLFVMRRDGSALSQITHDSYKDRAPRWSPDAEKILFLSDRSGRYEAWTVSPDGSGLRQLTHTTGSRWAQAPLWSPDGTRVACNLQASAPILFEAGKPWDQQSPRIASPGKDPDLSFFAWSWSPDGRKLAGHGNGILVFTTETEQLEKLAGFGERPSWLNDSRRLLFMHEDKMYLVDSATKEVAELLSVAPYRLQSFTLSRDNRQIFLSLSTTEADIWLASLQ